MYPHLDIRQHGKYNDELRKQTYKVWHKAVEFFNRASRSATHFPGTDSFGMQKKVITSALGAADTLAKASYAKSREIYEHLLKEAEDHIAETVSSLYIAQKWGYLNQAMYEELYEDGRNLTQALLELSSRSGFAREQLN